MINFTQSTGDGVISNFDRASGTINSLLQQMYANGQRRFRLPIFYSRGGETCTAPYPYTRSYYMDSTGGTLSPQCTQNIVNTLQAIQAQGFADVEVAFFPAPSTYSDPSVWPAGWSYTSPYESYYQDAINLIRNLHPYFAAANLNIKIDLLNEGMPPSAGYQGLVEYTSRMWAEYINQFGQGDTYGFSVPEGSIDRLSMMGAVYGSREPYVLDLHIYDNPYNSYTAACDYLSSNNHNQGW